MFEKELLDYIVKRFLEKESTGQSYQNTFLGIGCGYSCDEKIGAARKLLREINGQKGIQYSDTDINALTQVCSRLGAIVQRHWSELPQGFSRQYTDKIEAERRTAMASAHAHMIMFP